MNLPFSIVTERLLIDPLHRRDKDFIFQLLNTEGWKKFIGNRNIHSQADALAYIQKVLRNESVWYWTVKLKENRQAIGIITFIKRSYLDHHDIGFAFLPQFSKKGYAYEATAAVLHQLQVAYQLKNILATTLPENAASIKLLTKLGLQRQQEIRVEEEHLLVYGASFKN